MSTFVLTGAGPARPALRGPGLACGSNGGGIEARLGFELGGTARRPPRGSPTSPSSPPGQDVSNEWLAPVTDEAYGLLPSS